MNNENEFKQRGIKPIFDSSDKPVMILGSREMLQRVIQNLVSNCLKYSSGNVIFKIEERDLVKFTVENPVSDVDQIDVEKIFDRFYKADSSRNTQGTGLGLSITKLLVEKMGASISAYAGEGFIGIRIDFTKFI